MNKTKEIKLSYPPSAILGYVKSWREKIKKEKEGKAAEKMAKDIETLLNLAISILTPKKSN